MENIDWRFKIGKKRDYSDYDWRYYLQKEFVCFAEEVAEKAEVYNWNFWGGGTGNYAVSLSQVKAGGLYISIKMIASDNYYYYVSFVHELNPNNIANSEYKECIGKTMEEALHYLELFLLNNDYNRSFKQERICVMGGAYERFPLTQIWADEEMLKKKDDENILV